MPILTVWMMVGGLVKRLLTLYNTILANNKGSAPVVAGARVKIQKIALNRVELKALPSIAVRI